MTLCENLYSDSNVLVCTRLAHGDVLYHNRQSRRAGVYQPILTWFGRKFCTRVRTEGTHPLNFSACAEGPKEEL